MCVLVKPTLGQISQLKSLQYLFRFKMLGAVFLKIFTLLDFFKKYFFMIII